MVLNEGGTPTRVGTSKLRFLVSLFVSLVIHSVITKFTNRAWLSKEHIDIKLIVEKNNQNFASAKVWKKDHEFSLTCVKALTNFVFKFVLYLDQ